MGQQSDGINGFVFSDDIEKWITSTKRTREAGYRDKQKASPRTSKRTIGTIRVKDMRKSDYKQRMSDL